VFQILIVEDDKELSVWMREPSRKSVSVLILQQIPTQGQQISVSQ